MYSGTRPGPGCVYAENSVQFVITSFFRLNGSYTHSSDLVPYGNDWLRIAQNTDMPTGNGTCIGDAA
jgi:hypothetical protein